MGKSLVCYVKTREIKNLVAVDVHPAIGRYCHDVKAIADNVMDLHAHIVQGIKDFLIVSLIAAQGYVPNPNMVAFLQFGYKVTGGIDYAYIKAFRLRSDTAAGTVHLSQTTVRTAVIWLFPVALFAVERCGGCPALYTHVRRVSFKVTKIRDLFQDVVPVAGNTVFSSSLLRVMVPAVPAWSGVTPVAPENVRIRVIGRMTP